MAHDDGILANLFTSDLGETGIPHEVYSALEGMDVLWLDDKLYRIRLKSSGKMEGHGPGSGAVPGDREEG
jgi:hypothetical protein